MALWAGKDRYRARLSSLTVIISDAQPPSFGSCEVNAMICLYELAAQLVAPSSGRADLQASVQSAVVPNGRSGFAALQRLLKHAVVSWPLSKDCRAATRLGIEQRIKQQPGKQPLGESLVGLLSRLLV
jgi:hypothetical protein